MRLAFLDGVRAVAAWFVVLHHIWIESFPGFPENSGPWVVGWLRWGHLAVAVFIVLSGFSLILGPARNGDRPLGGNAVFFRRRTRRIVPPYWVALGISIIVILVYTGSRTGEMVNFRTVLVYGLLLQDVVGAPTPNGAFWSIAVEYHVYFLFPLMLLIVRRRNDVEMVLLTTVGVVALYLLGTGVGGLFEKFLHLTPQFIALFAMGVLAGRRLVHRPVVTDRTRRVVSVIAVSAMVGSAVVLAFGDPATLVRELFWVDLAFGAVVALACYAMGVGLLRPLSSLFASRVLVVAGMFSYSTYLIHYPVMSVVKQSLALPLGGTQLEEYLILLGVGVPLIALASYVFFRLFERPFLLRPRT